MFTTFIKSGRIVLLLCLAFVFSNAQGQNFTGGSIPVSNPALAERLQQWEVYELNAAAIDAYAQSEGENAVTYLHLGNHHWAFHLLENPIFAPEYTLRSETANGIISESAPTVHPYKGFTTNGLGKVRLTLAPEFISGYIEENGERWYIEPLWYTDPGYAKNLYVVYPQSAVIRDNLDAGCGVDAEHEQIHEDVEEKLKGMDLTESSSACYQVDLAIASDASMLTKYGSASNVEAHNIAVLNDVEGDYAGWFVHDIEFNIVIQFVSAANPWGANPAAGTYLANFRAWGNSGGFGVPYDLAEMWTNIDLTGSTIGIAYLSAVCTSNRYHVLQDFSGNSELLRCLTSHEIGHNFAASHDNCPTGGTVFIMCPFVSTSTEWSSASVNSINGHITSRVNNGCLQPCSSGPPPTADFDWNPNPACVNQQVTFNNMSSGNISTYNWTFPGGVPATSTQENPVVTWATQGFKNVTLVLNTGTASQATLSKQVEVLGNPVANFTSAVNGLTVTFTSSASNAIGWEWDFGDGEFSFEENPVHTYAEGNFYTVILTVTGPCGSATKTTLINTGPTAFFSASPVSGCTPLAVSFTNESSPNAISYSWQFPGGTPTASNQANPVVIYQVSGVYSVTLTAFNSQGNSMYSETNYITVQTIPSSNFTYTAAGNTVSFMNGSVGGTSFLWNFGDGETSTEQNPVHTYTTGGTFTVTLSTTNDCGTTNSVKTIVLASPPVSAFTATPTSGCGPLTVQFTNTSSNANTVEWSFPGGNPATSTANNPVVVYNTPGAFTATLTATNAAGSNSATQTITVLTVPASGFSAATNGATTTFSNSTTGGISWSWNFGDGSSNSTQQNPVHTYTADGTYTVVLTSTNNCGTSTATQTVTIVTPPTAGFTTGNATGCAPLTVQFNNASSANAVSYSWSFPGGTPATSTASNPTVVYTVAGQYSATLIVTNAAGSDTISQTNIVTVNTTPTAGFTTGVNGYQANFTNSSNGANSYSWAFGTGATSSQANPSYTYPAAGTYTVTLTSSNDCGTATATQTVDIIESPTAAFTATPTTGCNTLTVQFTNASSGNPTSFAWQFPGGTPAVSTQENPVVIYNAPGTYNVIFTASNGAGTGTVTQSNYITVSTTPTAGFTSANTANVFNFTNTSTGATAYSWNFGDTGTSNIENPSHTYTMDGTYTVVLTATNACGTTTSTQTVTVVTPPTAGFAATGNNGCAPLTVTFNNTSSANATTFAWQFPGGIPATSTAMSPTVVYNTPGTYSVTLTSSNIAGSASTTQTNIVTVGTTPTSSFSSNVSGAMAAFTNMSTNAVSWSWNFGDGSNSNLQNATHTYTMDGTYTVVLTSTNACGSSTATQTITIQTPPTANFTATGNAGCAPLTVTFNNTSSANATTFAWQFPGGTPSTSNAANPVVTYTTPGIYSVILTASNAQGNSMVTQTDLIIAGGAPTSGFIPTVNGAMVNFGNTSTGATAYVWNFGDGNNSSVENPVHTFQNDGTYTVTLTATNSCGTTTSTQTVVVTTAPSADFSASATSGCAPIAVLFSNNSSANATSFSWTFPGGNPSVSSDENPVVSYEIAGTYSVTLVATNSAGSATETKMDLIVVSTAPTTEFSYITGGLSVEFTNGSFNAVSYDWDFGDGGVSTEIDPTHDYSAPGVYTVTLTATNACGTATFVSEIIIEGTAPAPAFSAGDATIGCAPLSVQYMDESVGQPTAWEWAFQGGTPSSSTDQNPVVVYSTPGVFNVSLTVTNAFGSNSIVKTNLVEVYVTPTAAFEPSVSGAGVTVNNTSSNATSYQWDFGDGSPVSTEAAPTHTYTVSGTYTISLTALNDCGVNVFQQTVNVTVVGVGEADFAAQFRLYPNPNNGVFTLEISGKARPELQMELFNTLGQMVYRNTGNFSSGHLAQVFHLEQLSSGIYSLRVSDGTQSTVVKVTIEK